MTFTVTLGRACRWSGAKAFSKRWTAFPKPRSAKLNLDNLIDNSLIQELEKEGFLQELYPEGAKR